MSHDTPTTRDHYVYRAVAADGTILYVGVSGNLPQRIAYHRYRAEWAHQVVRYAATGPLGRDAAYALEKEEIRRLKPLHNIRTYPDGPLGLPAADPAEAPLNLHECVTTKQVSEELGVSIRTVARMIRDKVIHPAWKGHGHTGPYMFTRAELDRVNALRGVAA